jgi:hypothetical protein
LGFPKRPEPTGLLAAFVDLNFLVRSTADHFAGRHVELSPEELVSCIDLKVARDLNHRLLRVYVYDGALDAL